MAVILTRAGVPAIGGGRGAVGEGSGLRRLVIVVGVALLVAMMGFLTWDEGLPAYQRAQPVPAVTPGERLALPAQVYDPPEYVRAVSQWGAPGPVALVFAGRETRVGFSRRVDDPWYAVSARDGGYRLLDPPGIERLRGRLWLSPQGTRIAWWRPGGIAVYDTMTGRSTEHAVALPAGRVPPLAWSPDGNRVAFGSAPVRVLDVRDGAVSATALSGPGASAPSWTADGAWVGLAAGDAIELAEPSSDRRRRIPAAVDGVEAGAWNDAGDFAGLHATARRNVLRVVRAAASAAAGSEPGAATVDDVTATDLVIQRFWGWSGRAGVILSGLRPETGGLEQAMRLSLRDGSVSTFIVLPPPDGNWRGGGTVSAAADLLARPTEAFDKPTMEWSPTAKLVLCLLATLFPAAYVLISRRRSG